MQIFWQQLQTPLSQKGKAFCGFFIAFLKCAWRFEHSEKKRRVSSPNYYRNYSIRKRCLLKRLKGVASAHHSIINVSTGSKHCSSSQRHHYFHIFPWIRDKLSWKKSPLVISEIFRLFVNTLTPDEKYSRRNMQICWQQLQTLLSQQEKKFCGFLIEFPKCAWNLEHSEKKEVYPSLIITEIVASERDIYLSI